MKRKIFPSRIYAFLILSLIFIPVSLVGQTSTPDSAQTIVKAALLEAQSAKKNVFLIFHATWCGWCKRLEKAINDTAVKPLIDENYILTLLDVQERGDKIQTFENPGGQNLMSGYGGGHAGLPFFVFLDKHGKVIANSNAMPKKQNIGYPGSIEEITAFVNLLKETAPHLTGNQREIIQNYFEVHAPK